MGRSIKSWAVLLILVAFVWGTTFAVMKDLLEEISLYNFLFWRFLLAGLFLAVWSGRRWKGMDRDRIKQAVLLGVVLFAGYWTQVLGLNLTTASEAGFITGLSVVLVPLLAVGLGQEKLRLQSSVGAAISLLGLFLLNYEGQFSFGLGEFFVLLCAFFFALYIVLVSRYAPDADGPPFVALQILIMAGLVGVLGLFLAPYPPWQSHFLSGGQWMQIAYMGIVATALAYLWEHKAQQILSATFTAIALAMEPVFATIFAYFYLTEILPAINYVGGFLIVGGMILAGREEKKADS